jgi:DNA-binding transcriptional ArsR family regulator
LINSQTAIFLHNSDNNMKRRTALTTCFILMVCSISLLSIVYAQNSFLPLPPQIQGASGSHRLVFSMPLVVGAGLHNNSNLLNQPTRMEIYDCAKSNPGIHFRGICSALDLPIGVVQYHLNILTRAGLLQVYSDGQCRRYFETDAYAEADMQTISLLKHDTARKIIAALSQSSPMLHKNLAQAVGLSSQALSWQMNQLKQTGLIEAEQEGMSVNYSLNHANAASVKLLLNLVDRSSINHI